VSFMPTPLAEAAMNEAWPEKMALRALLTGGDKLKRRPPENFPCAFINHYGPTESTVVATSAEIDKHAPAAATPPIGRPIANTQAYVLDPQLRPVPAGVMGELYLGGESLARGYLNRPELTAEKFVTLRFPPGRTATQCHPLDDKTACHLIDDKPSSVRLYRTGDLVRWTIQGELEFLGRIDGQVKVRGCRIELGEIEATIHQHPAARESVVITRPDERGQLQLVAYVVAHSGTAASTEAELMEFLRAKLPVYMVPSAIVLLDAWPLTPNGKIDRKALPAPEVRSTGSRAGFAAPRTAVEQTIAKVWADVLGCGTVGITDNFFDLGGHSLLAAQVVTRLNATMSGAVSVRALFDQPTLAAFARQVEQQLENPNVRTPIQRVRRRTPRPEMELVQPN
jgi:acyl-CoA synthetase (AMP-forming)/AMP-acid ligase II